MKTEATIRIVARLANFYHNYFMNISYVQNNLKRNLSPQAWMNTFKVLGFFTQSNLSSGTRIAAVVLQVTKLLIFDQLEGIKFEDIPQLPLLNLSSPDIGLNHSSAEMPIRKMNTFRMSPTYVKAGATSSSSEEQISSPRSSEVIDPNTLEENSDSSYNANLTSSSSSESEEEEIGTIYQIDTLLAPEEIKNTKVTANATLGSSPAKSVNAAATDNRNSSEVKNNGFPLTHVLPVIKDTDEKSSQDDFALSERIREAKNSMSIRKSSDDPLKEENAMADRNKFTFKSKIARVENTLDITDHALPQAISGELASLMNMNMVRKTRPSPAALTENNLSIGRKSRKTGQSAQLNDGKVKTAKITNTSTADNIQKVVARESAMDWKGFDIYAGDNKYDIKEVLKTFIESFNQNIALNITLEKNSAHLLINYSSDLVVRNNALGKRRTEKGASTIFQPTFSLITQSEAKRKEKKFSIRLFGLFNSSMRSIFMKDILSLENSDKISIHLHNSPQQKSNIGKNKPQRYDIRSLFMGKELDQASIEYFMINLRSHLGTILNSSAKELPRRGLEINFLFEIPGVVLVTDSSILPWISIIALNFVMIYRRMKFIKYVPISKIAEFRNSMRITLEEAVISGDRITVFLDFTRYLDDNNKPEAGIREVLNFISLCQLGEVLNEYSNEFLENIVVALRKEDYIKTISYDELINQIKKTIEQNVSFVLIVSPEYNFDFCSLMHRCHPVFFSRTVYKVFKQMDIAKFFEKTVHYKLLSCKKPSRQNSSYSQSQMREESSPDQNREDKDSVILRQRLKDSFISLDMIDHIRKSKQCSVNAELVWTILDLGLSMSVYYTHFEKQMYLDAVAAIEKCLIHQTVGSDVSASIDSTSIEMQKVLIDFNLAKLMHFEEIFIKLILEGLTLTGPQVNLISLVHLSLLDEYSFVPIVYDPTGLCQPYFKVLLQTKKNQEFVLIEGADGSIESLSKHVETGSTVILHLQKLGKEMKTAVVSLLKGIAIYQFGKDLEYFIQRSSAPRIQIGDKKIKMGNGFRVCLIFRKRQDLIEVLQRFKGSFVIDMIKLIVFEESITSFFTNATSVYKELDNSLKLHEWVSHLKHQLSIDSASHVFTLLNDFSNLFSLNELTNLKNVNINRPDEPLHTFDYLNLIKQICGLNIKDSSKINTLVIEDVCRLTIQFKTRMSLEVPFDSTYREKYVTTAVTDLTTIYQKMLLYFGKVRGSENPGVDSAYLYGILYELLDQFKSTIHLKYLQRGIKLENESLVIELDVKQKLGLVSEKLVRALENDNPSFWNQLILGFVVHCSQILPLKEREFFILWNWMNHFEHKDSTSKKLTYSNTLVKRGTIVSGSSPIKLMSTEKEIEHRDLSILVSQAINPVSYMSPSIESDSKTNLGSSKLRVATFKLDIRQIYIDLYGIGTDDNFVNIDPFIKPKRTESKLGSEERIAPPPPIVLMQRTATGSKAITSSPTVEQEHISNMSEKVAKILALQNSKHQYKKSRFAPGGPASGSPKSSLAIKVQSGKKAIQMIEEKSEDSKAESKEPPKKEVIAIQKQLIRPTLILNVDKTPDSKSNSKDKSEGTLFALASPGLKKRAITKATPDESFDTFSPLGKSTFNKPIADEGNRLLSMNQITNKREEIKTTPRNINTSLNKLPKNKKDESAPDPSQERPKKQQMDSESSEDSIGKQLEKNKHLDSEQDLEAPKQKLQRFATKGGKEASISDDESSSGNSRRANRALKNQTTFGSNVLAMKRGNTKTSKIKTSESYTKKVTNLFAKTAKKALQVQEQARTNQVKQAVKPFRVKHEGRRCLTL